METYEEKIYGEIASLSRSHGVQCCDQIAQLAHRANTCWRISEQTGQNLEELFKVLWADYTGDLTILRK